MQGLPEHGHVPVMMEEVLRGLGLETANQEIRVPRVIMDCTVGRGGHAVRIAQAMAERGGGMLICLDVDPENLKYARGRIEREMGNGKWEMGSGEAGGVGGNDRVNGARSGGGCVGGVEVRTFQANFGEVEDVMAAVGLTAVGRKLDGLLADFGVSTNQLMEGRHGLSFATDLPLDMRLDPRIKKKAADLVAEMEEKELAKILQEYAQERYAWRIARKIAQTRVLEPIKTTGQLARLVRSVVPGKWGQIDPATRTFQALRMAVNNEVEVIEELLAAVPGMMNRGGRGVFLSFHSGEDRLVKQAIRGWEESGVGRSLTKKPEEPGENEMSRNPRARSAKLRSVDFNHDAATTRRELATDGRG